MKRKIILCDIDFTLVDPSHRDALVPHYSLRNDPSAWVPYNRACIDDAPIWPTITLMRALQAQGYLLHLLTARGSEVKAETQKQMANICIKPEALHMRPMDNCLPSAEFKRSVVRQIGAANIFCAFEDQCLTVQMLREEGIQTYQVSKHLSPGLHQI